MIRATVAALVLAVGTSSVAYADAKAEAMALFEQGIKDMEAGKTDLACRELGASLTTYEDSGTKGALAECYTQLGRLASAWRLWKELSDTAPTEDLKSDAAANAAKLLPRLPRFKVTLGGPSIPGLVVTVEGSPADPTLEIELPIDPGPIAATATAPQYEAWTSTFTAFEGKVTTIEIPRLRPLVEPARPPPGASAPGPGPSREELLASRHRRHLIGAALGISGVAGVGVGVLMGSRASSSWSQAEDDCMQMLDPCRGDLEAARKHADDARLAARISTGLFIVGGAALVSGAIYWFTAPSVEAQARTVQLTPAVSSGSVGLVISGSWR
jgi:hypothetical protein